jgi:hypothetical protein
MQIEAREGTSRSPFQGYSFHGHTRKSWFNYPLRWVNPTLVQNDPGQWDPDFWLDFIKRAKCDAASWNSGGIIAFYPTQIPHHKRNEWMGDSDPFGYVVEGCRKLGIIVTARVDHHATYEEAAIAHPEWLARDAEGNPVHHSAKPDLYITCGYGPYNSEFMTSVLREVQTMYGVDGFNHNRWAGSVPVCYCDFCRTDFENTGHGELPRGEQTHNIKDPLWRKYLLWRQDHIFRLWDLWDSEIRKINPNTGLLPGIPGGLLRQLDIGGLKKRAHSLYHDHQGRSGASIPPWSGGRGGKELRAVIAPKLVGNTWSVGHDGRHRWKDSVQSEAELRIWTADCAANGMSLKFCKFSGTLHDTRWLDYVEKIYNRLESVEDYLRDQTPLARIAMVYSQQTQRAQPEHKDHSNGMYHALIEARIPFEMVHESLMEPEDVDKYKLLILPNIAALSDEQCRKLREYVERGGSILATHETSLYDEWGDRRENFGLSDLFGVTNSGPTQGPIKNSYLRMEHQTGHPILEGLEDAGRIINGVNRVPVQANVDFTNPPVTLIPAYPDLPMEEVYPREDHTEIPEVYLREIGESRIAYVPFDLDRTFWEVLDVDHGRLLRNLVQWATGEEPPVIVTGQGVLDITLWKQRDSMTVHLVNFTNPMMMKGPFRELIAIGEQKVRVQLPVEREIKRVHLLMSDQTPKHEIEDGYLNVTVPSILDHEIIAIDFSS